MRLYHDYNWPGKEGTKVLVHDDDHWKYIYYEDHEERHKGIGWRERELYPDEIVVPGMLGFITIKRVRKRGELTNEEWQSHGWLAAKDVPVD